MSFSNNDNPAKRLMKRHVLILVCGLLTHGLSVAQDDIPLLRPEEREAVGEDLCEEPGEETAGDSVEPAGAEGETSVRDALREQVLRLQADFDNYRKRQARDFHRLCSQGKRDLIADMLVILDDFDRARRHFESGSQPSEILPGIFQTASHMAAILGKDGLEAMDLEPMMPFVPPPNRSELLKLTRIKLGLRIRF